MAADPSKPRRKVTSQISTGHSSSPSMALRGTVRAKVAPTSIASPSTASLDRPSLRSTPSSVSLRSHVTAASAPVSRARSPVPPASSTPPARASARTPTHYPSATSGLGPRTPAATGGTPAVRVRAARSMIDGGTGRGATQTPEAQMRRNMAEKSAASSQQQSSANRARAPSMRSAMGDNPPVARVRPSSGAVSTPSPIAQPVPRSSMSTSSVAGSSHPAESSSLGMSASPPTGSWVRHPSPERMESPPRLTTHRSSSPYHRSPTAGTGGTHAQLNHVTAHIQHPIASAPNTPNPYPVPILADPPHSAQRAHGGSRPRLPFNYTATAPPTLPIAPGSPEMRVVALPPVSPGRSSTEMSRSGSSARRFSDHGSGVGSDSGEVLLDLRAGGGDRNGHHRGMGIVEALETVELHGAPVGEHPDAADGVQRREVDAEDTSQRDDAEVDDMLGADAHEAKINRKIADLEISNASLLAINKMLEATKSKQRAEIFKLRRRLRETLSPGSNPFPSAQHMPTSPLGMTSPTSPTISALSGSGADPELVMLDNYHDEEMADPQLDARWDKVVELLQGMKQRADGAVRKGNEVGKGGGGRVLGWLEMEEREGAEREDADGEGTPDIGTPQRQDDGESLVGDEEKQTEREKKRLAM
ncbi:hypothetical protein IAT38_001645 [Cryptococcus sp. DSM 104549]